MLNNLYKMTEDNIFNMYIEYDPNLENKKSEACGLARVVIVKRHSMADMSEWFKLPSDTIKSIVNGNISGKFVISLNKMSENERTSISEYSEPRFKISKKFNKDTYIWIKDLLLSTFNHRL